MISKQIRKYLEDSNFVKNNVGSLAIVIGQTGNLNYTGLNDLFQQMKIRQLLPLLTEKEFLLTINGILKLGLFDTYF